MGIQKVCPTYMQNFVVWTDADIRSVGCRHFVSPWWPVERNIDKFQRLFSLNAFQEVTRARDAD